MGRNWTWFILVVALLLFISSEAATADGNISEEKGKSEGSDDDGKGKEIGDGKGNNEGKGKGKEGSQGDKNNKIPPMKGNEKKKGKGEDKIKGKEKAKGKGKDKSKGKDKKGGNEKGNGKKNGAKNSPPYHPPPSPSPPQSASPPAQTPPIPPKEDSTDYYLVSPVERTGQEQGTCQAQGSCYNATLTCPNECPHRKPDDHKMKGCFIDCSSKCEATCKWRKPNCDNYGSLCYDPRFVGGDGSMFYFHGFKGSNFAIVSDANLHINAHFIGTRPMGRTRDFTWVQALSIMFDTHTLVLEAQKVSKWDDKLDYLTLKWDGHVIKIPTTDALAEWRTHTENQVVVVERTDYVNTVRVTVSGLVQVDTRVVPIGEKENKVHSYQIPDGDVFAHLETQFTFFQLLDSVEGVLGKTYQPGFESPVKKGVDMPIMGGEDKYQTPSLDSPLCRKCKFQRPSANSKVAMVSTI